MENVSDSLQRNQGLSPRGKSVSPKRIHPRRLSRFLSQMTPTVQVTPTAQVTFYFTLPVPGSPSSLEGGLRYGVPRIQSSSWIPGTSSRPGGYPCPLVAASSRVEQVGQNFISGRSLLPAIPSIESLCPTPGLPDHFSPHAGSRSSRSAIRRCNYGVQQTPSHPPPPPRLQLPRGAGSISLWGSPRMNHWQRSRGWGMKRSRFWISSQASHD